MKSVGIKFSLSFLVVVILAQKEKHGEGIPKRRPFLSKRLWKLIQSFAWADAKLCVGSCKALR